MVEVDPPEFGISLSWKEQGLCPYFRLAVAVLFSTGGYKVTFFKK